MAIILRGSTHVSGGISAAMMMWLYVVGKKYIYLFMGPGRGRNLVHRLGVKWHLSFSRAVSHRIELARMYICRQYRGYVRSPTRQGLREPNHPKDVNGSHHGISIDLLLVQPIQS